MSENNISINITNENVINVPRQSRGAGTVLMFVFFWWLLPTWWSILFSLWLIWIIIDGFIAIFNADFFMDTWYYPLNLWLFGIR
jgi:hypothetical protein